MKINTFIDHTLLKATATSSAIEKLCEEAKTYAFASVCVNSCFVAPAAHLLQDSGVKVCTVVGFPLGVMSTKAKVFEASQAIKDGADEIDMVINLGWLKGQQYELVKNDITAVKEALPHHTLKVILETCYLNDEEIVTASQLAMESNADFIKTSTGFGTSGATIPHVKLMRKTVGDAVKIKASGGIRDYDTAMAFIEAGADRLGVSSGVAIMEGKKSNSTY